MRSINGLAGAMFGAGIDMTLGQKPDKKLAKSIGDVFGFSSSECSKRRT